MCPQGRNCGPLYLRAKRRAQTYWVYTEVLDSRENLCNHELAFSIDAGLGDTLNIKFKDVVDGTVINFAVGLSFIEAKGEIIQESLASKMIKVDFPNKLFMTIEHSLHIPGRFEFEFWYTSQDENYGNETQLEENLDETYDYRLYQI